MAGLRRRRRFRGVAKIAALGIKVAGGCSYHGVALNVAMDLAPYALIDPCGYAGLRVVDLATLGVKADCQDVGMRLSKTAASASIVAVAGSSNCIG